LLLRLFLKFLPVNDKEEPKKRGKA